MDTRGGVEGRGLEKIVYGVIPKELPNETEIPRRRSIISWGGGGLLC